MACNRGSPCGGSLFSLGGETMAKPFLTYRQQIQLLRDKGMLVEDEAFIEAELHRYGYFSLISGYKDLLKNPTTKNYRDGTSFHDLIAIYRFDERLRELTLRYLLPHAEFLVYKKDLSKLLDTLCRSTRQIVPSALLAMMGLPENWKSVTAYRKT